MAWSIENGITFGTRHTYDDWHMYLKKRPFVTPPKVKTNYVNVPGADGQIDLTEALGAVRFEAREFEAELYMVDGLDDWDSVLSDVLNTIQGKRVAMIFDTDPTYQWSGRFYVEKVESRRLGMTMTIKGTVDPYKTLISDGSVKSL